jgi:hypothetical protein
LSEARFEKNGHLRSLLITFRELANNNGGDGVDGDVTRAEFIKPQTKGSDCGAFLSIHRV